MSSVSEAPQLENGSGDVLMTARLLAFVIGAFFSAVAGSLYAHFITSFSPTVFYFDLTFRVITMLVLGGMGSVSGSILGSIAIVGLTEGLRRVEDATLLYGLSQIILAVVFIVVITVRREGLPTRPSRRPSPPPADGPRSRALPPTPPRAPSQR
jgi:branched-chain amino acid transport system permease protein